MFRANETERLPVLEDLKSRRIVGTISQRDILAIYSLECLHRRTWVARIESPDDHAAPKYIELPAEHQIDDIPVPEAVVGMTVGEAHFRERYGTSILLVHRQDAGGRETRIVPTPATTLEKDDHLIVLGPRDRLLNIRGEMRPGVQT
jgi:Trk K+ transport system NAD-binding subunit